MLSTILKHPLSMKTLLTNVRSVCEITEKYLRHDKNVFPMVLAVRTFLTKSIRLSDGLVQSTRFFKPSKLPQSLLVRHQQTKKLDIDTNVINNVILYKHDNRKYIRKMQLFAVTLLLGWTVLAIYTYTPAFFDIFNTDITFKQYMYNNMLRLSFFSFAIFGGPIAYAMISAVCSRTIRYIVLHKGGENVTFTTSNLWKKNHSIQVPISKVKCIVTRTGNESILPLKIQDKPFYYLIEKKGIFVNPELFDQTLGFSHFRKM